MYTKSIDGKSRCNVTLKLRFTKKEIKEIKEMVVLLGGDPTQWRSYLHDRLLDYIWIRMPELADSFRDES